jgi:hypothetical protein
MISPGLSGYECNVTDLSFIRRVPLYSNFFILDLGESGYCSARNSIRVNDLFTVVFKWLHINLILHPDLFLDGAKGNENCLFRSSA